jgi:hypothetical protein
LFKSEDKPSPIHDVEQVEDGIFQITDFTSTTNFTVELSKAFPDGAIDPQKLTNAVFNNPNLIFEVSKFLSISYRCKLRLVCKLWRNAISVRKTIVVKESKIVKGIGLLRYVAPY